MSIKNIKEKVILVNLAKQFGEQPDPKIIAEIEQHNKLQNKLKSSIRQNFEKDFLSAFSDIKKELPKPLSVTQEQIVTQLDRVENILYPLPPSLDDLQIFLVESEDPVTEIEQVTPKNVSEGETIEMPETSDEPKTLVDAASKFISDNSDTQELEEFSPTELEISALTRKVKYLEQWISRIAATGPGGGEVKLLRLDDVDKTNIGNNKYLKYNATTGKMVFDTPSGGGGLAYVTTDDTAPADPVDGMLWFNTVDGRLYIYLVENNIGQWADTGDGIGGPINMTTTSVTTNTYTVQDSDNYIGVNYSGTVTITMPTTAGTGKVIVIKDESGNCSVNPIIISGTVDNDINGAVLQINNGALQLVYKSGWRIV